MKILNLARKRPASFKITTHLPANKSDRRSDKVKSVWCVTSCTRTQVAQGLRDRYQSFLAEQLPEHQLDVARAAGTFAAFNESNSRPTDDMLVDQNSPAAAAGMTLAREVVRYLCRCCILSLGWVLM